MATLESKCSISYAPWSLVPGPWPLVLGPLVPVPWSPVQVLVHGPWSLSPGPCPWSLETMSRRLNQVENRDFIKLTLPQWRSRSEVSYGSPKTPKLCFPNCKNTQFRENTFSCYFFVIFLCGERTKFSTLALMRLLSMRPWTGRGIQPTLQWAQAAT